MALDGWDVRPWHPTSPGATLEEAGNASVKEAAMAATISPTTPTRSAAAVGNGRLPLLWVGFVVASLLALDVLDTAVWSIAVPLAAVALWLGTTRWWRAPVITRRAGVDRRDLAVIGALYVAVVGLWQLAFTVFTADRWLPLFLCFGVGLLLGVAGPVVYTVRLRRRRLRSLGLGVHRPRETFILGLGFAGVQAVIMLWGYRLPAPVDGRAPSSGVGEDLRVRPVHELCGRGQ
jgi:hypothetical protein